MSASAPNTIPKQNYRFLARTIGSLILAIAASMSLPLAWSLRFGSDDWSAFLVSMSILAVPGIVLSRIKTNGTMRPREAVLSVALGWVVCSAASTLPLILSGSLPRLVDAMFETMSGLTTTGATVLQGIETHPAGVLYWRSFLHWLGGLGIIVIFLAVLPNVGLGGTRMFQAEVPGPQKQRLRPKLRDTAKLLLWIYVALTFMEMTALVLAGMSFYEAQIHTFGTIATGGFSNRTASIAAYDSTVIEAIIILFMVAAGTNFALYYRAVLMGDRKAFGRDPEFRWYLVFLGVATALVAISIAGRVGALAALRQAAFQVASIMTTTGFFTADFDAWPEMAKLVLLLLMFVGASAGSTGGAIKVSRLLIFGKHLWRELLKIIHPTAVIPVTVGKAVIPERTTSQVSAFIGLYASCFLGGLLYMSYLGLDLPSAASSVAAALGNVGPGLGAVGPVCDYAFLPDSGKVILTLLMLLGRLEIFTVLAVMMPAFWRR